MVLAIFQGRGQRLRSRQGGSKYADSRADWQGLVSGNRLAEVTQPIACTMPPGY